MKTAAFFDVDYTLVDGSSSIEFMKYLFWKGKLPLRIILDAVQFYVKYKFNRISYSELAKRTKLPYIKNKKSKYVKDISQEFFEKILNKKINKKALNKIKTHMKKRHKIVLATASIDFLIRPLADHLGADFISTGTEIKDNYYTGKLTESVCYGKTKAKLVNRYANENKIDLTKSYAYSDHISDLEFLKLVGHPYFVNPNRKIKRIAKKEKIKIIYF